MSSVAFAEDYQVNSVTITGGNNKVIGSTMTLEVEVVDVPSANSPGPVTLNIGTTGGSNVFWTPVGAACTGNTTPPTDDFTCLAPAGSPVTYTFTSTEIDQAASYNSTVDISGANCSSGCTGTTSFTVYEPTLTIALAGGGSTVTEGDVGNTSVNVEFTLSELPQGSFTQSIYEVTNVSAFGTNPAASLPGDFTGLITPPYLTWTSASGSTTQTVTLQITGDTIAEATESIYIGPGDIQGIAFSGTPPRFELPILDNDGPSTPTVSVSANSSIAENGGSLVATVSIDTLPPSVTNVNINSAPGSSSPASTDDFEQKSVSITFDGPGAIAGPGYTVINPTTVQVNFAVFDDSDAEPNEIFDVFLDQQSGLIISSTAGFQNVTIIDDDTVATPPVISASPQRSFSEDSGQATITFTRSGGLDDPISFDFATLDSSPLIKSAATSGGTATAGSDYTSTSATVSWAAGEGGTKSVSIPIINDNLFEGDETFRAQASNLSSGASFDFDPNLVLTIIEDDVEPGGEINFSAASYDVNEDAGTATITVTRSGGSNGAVSVSYASSDDSATAGSDYSASAGTLSWAAGDIADKTFSIPVTLDIINEPTETVLLELSNPSGSATLGNQANSELNIINVNEAGAPNISKEDISVTDFDGDGLVDVVLDATGKIVSDNPINDVTWLKEGEPIANGMVTSAKLPIGTHPLRVIATDNNGKKAGVDFIAEVKELDPESTRMLSDTPGLNGEQGTVAGALDELCPRLSEFGQQNGLTTGQSNLRTRCEQLRDPDLNDEDIVDALDQIAGEEAEAIIITAARFTNMHHTNLRNRFTQLRRGGSAIIDVSGLNMRFDGGNLNGHMFASVGRELLGGAASADEEPEIYRDSRLGLFVNGNISYGERDPTQNNSGFKLDIEGITAGMDYRFTDKFIGGIAVGYSSSDLDYANDGGVLEGSSTFYSAYTSYYSDTNYYIDSSLTYADSEFDVTRHIKYKDMSGIVDLRRGGSTNGEQLLATLDFGWDYNNGPWTFGPNGSLSYSDTSIDGYAEQGDSGLELQYSGQDNVTGTLGLGFHGSRVFLMNWGVLIANINGNYYREFKNQNGVIRASFVHDPFRFDSNNPTSEMLIISDIPDRNYFSLGLGLAAQFKYGLSGFIDYQSLLAADDIRSRELAFGLRYEAKF
ncbi:autotransporter domain-containing protein [Pseudoteredinibacter isoporae]|uniref:autotransporter family protein n=1 Tax=Pseudoteredinibacter isoporae TaxID=570281 RepID=UPI003108D27A